MTELAFDSIDDYLGPADGRFFGSGYRRARYEIGDVEVTPDGTRSTISVHYPADWSKKDREVDLRPHLSTVDMLVLGVRLSEAHLAHALGLDAAQRRVSWLRKVTLRSGTAPQEDLTGLTGTARLRETKPVSDTEFVSVYDCAIGAMRARCEIQHPAGSRTGQPVPGTAALAALASLDDAVGQDSSRYYGAGFTERRHRITGVRVDMANLRAEGSLWLDPTEPGAGIDGAYQPAVSVVDCFVANLQLVQVMMYELDSVRRQDSNTLWMLKTVLAAESPHRPCSSPLECRAAITGKHRLPLRGAMWRNVDISGECGGVTLRSTFAHELPANTLIEEAS